MGVFSAFKGLVKIPAPYRDLLERLGREQPGVIRSPLGPRSKSSAAKNQTDCTDTAEPVGSGGVRRDWGKSEPC